MTVKRGVDGLQEILGGIPFPADKDAIVAGVQDAGGDREMLSAVQAMPPARYDEPNEVLRSVPLQPEGRSRTESAKAQQQHGHTTGGASEKDQPTRPVNPIEEELGENRKA